MAENLEDLLAYCRANNRVCPLPLLWRDLWRLLPERRRVGVGWVPPVPLILAAWHDTPPVLKMARLAEHLDWAERHGTLERTGQFVRGLNEDDWHHIGDPT